MTPPVLRTLITLALAAIIIGLTMLSAMRRGMDHVVPISKGDQTAVAISLSKSIYHTQFGYVGQRQVYDKLYEHWNRDSKGWSDAARLKVNFRNAELLNTGIHAASSLGAQKPGFVSDGTLITMNGNDVGQVDYVTLAFKLFGAKIQSLFYLYFAAIGLSAFIFILTFRDNAYAIAILLCTLAAYYIERYFAIFDPIAMPTYFGMRHGSTMCLVAMWHFVCLLIWRRSPGFWTMLGAVVQLAILILAWRIRGTSAWIFMLLFFLALAMAGRHLQLRQLKVAGILGMRLAEAGRALAGSIATAAKSTIPFAEDALRWPVILLAAGLAASSLYDRATLHPVYSTDDVMPGRGMWSDAYQALAMYEPRVLDPRVAAGVDLPAAGGELSWWGARAYMDRIRISRWDGKLDIAKPAPGLTSEWTGVGVRTAMQDRMAHGAFIEAVKSSPLRVLGVYLISKPLHIVSTLTKTLTQGRAARWLLLTILIGAGIGALVVVYGPQGDFRTPRDVILLSGAAVLAAITPNLWSYASPTTMADSVLLLAAFLPIAIGMGGAMILARSGQRRNALVATAPTKERTMRAIMTPLYRIAERANGYALAQLLAKPTTDRFRALILRHVCPGPHQELLDVGCGVGNYRNSFACKYTGIDINPDYIERSRATLDGRYMVMDATRLEFEDAAFDHVITVATLHHLTDEQVTQMVREATRVCKPSGRVHIIDAILPVTPNFTFKRMVFRADRGEYPRDHDHLLRLIGSAGHIEAKELVAGPLHDVAYVGVTRAA